MFRRRGSCLPSLVGWSDNKAAGAESKKSDDAWNTKEQPMRRKYWVPGNPDCLRLGHIGFVAAVTWYKCDDGVFRWAAHPLSPTSKP